MSNIFKEIQELLNAEQTNLLNIKRKIVECHNGTEKENKVLRNIDKQVDISSFMLELAKEVIDDYNARECK